MAKLSDLGFSKAEIVETVVSTYDSTGEPNAAPMGVALTDERYLVINFFNSSATLANVKSRGCAVLNLTGNIEVYYRSAFKEANPNGVLPKEWFSKAEAVNAPKLRSAEATIDVSMADVTALGSGKTQVTFAVELLHAPLMYPQVYCRAFGATLEAIVHATRVKVLADDPAEQEHVVELLKEIQCSSEVVRRVAPNSSYSAVMADLTKRIDAWCQK